MNESYALITRGTDDDNGYAFFVTNRIVTVSTSAKTPSCEREMCALLN